MKERPILFRSEMVRAIMDGRKSMTRRLLKEQSISGTGWSGPIDKWTWSSETATSALARFCPHGAVGDRLWVKEAWAWPGEEEVLYRATDQCIQDKMRTDPNYPQFSWRSPLFMPRWASRITLEITDVRVERLQEISEEDARAEGAEPALPVADRRWVAGYRRLWESIHGPESWASNPWVFVISFRNVSEATNE